nr:hypothetical protein [Treponema sp.]
MLANSAYILSEQFEPDSKPYKSTVLTWECVCINSMVAYGECNQFCAASLVWDNAIG